MNFPFYIARRYLFSKKSTHAINLISAISVLGVAIATMAMVVTLSVFNGFHDLVATFFTSFDPQLKVTPAKGKTAPSDDPILTQIKNLPEVDIAMECVEDQALAIYDDRQAMVMIKGVEDNFNQLTHFSEILIPDKGAVVDLHAANLEFGIPGARLTQTLLKGTTGWHDYLHIYAPEREGQLDMTNPEAAFVEDSLLSTGNMFNMNQSKYDANYIITSIAFARNLFGQQGMLSSLELRLKPGSNFDGVKKQMKKLAGDKYLVEDRYEQQADTYKIMRIEKYIAYVFLTFILMVASFNIIGSLSMLIIDKKEDVVTLRNLGASNKQISKIFLFEGRLITLGGAILGILLGLLLCWMQQRFGLVALGNSSGSFIVDAYPVSVHFSDVALIFITVIAVGWIAVWYPIRHLSKRLLDNSKEE
ncbi:MAG: FtsX-like permease family protein [Prevotella sp.]|nr:FtsX-like permease family protein [Prevotella sp.]